MEAYKYYQEQGYYIFRQLISHELIDSLLAEYQSKIVASNDYFFRQSSNKWEKNKISIYGYCEESLLDIHDYPNHSSFSDSALRIFCLPEVRNALTLLTGEHEHNVMQTMFFDLNTATPAHQDWYYLDSMPNGHLLAGWFALEDIQQEAGRFYVLPKSHLIDFELTIDEKISSPYYQQKLKKYLEAHKEEMYAPALQKGDVLFWNSRTIHGSSATLDASYSRKSLTAHYLPSKYQFGNRYATSPKAVEYASYEGMKYKLAPVGHKHYSVPNKVQTDLYHYLSQRPKLMRIAQFIRKPLKSSRG
ncbi:hypothetical protein DSM106972_035740 [Dulcicalothrix desertica PCC 7102]|uniref:Phytanoyl-CoA dioxygenase n=1 Tax=Dulcicalothrix desertica PCC 7102 TaxID=232991 RepID=A0A3S5K387_9CYAN|nr:phytanoyl-CoA dioxygenase family protein [Dulcicalothrix desertica]RUT05567.1 hypothetical protein DSM106972_035740 [Dulcicalothrix desertica PCC 7102]TWH54663.1 phytanoyl-CoA hydroxylase [Dulcicalothrix desertica PCC 7102]